jgi:hypothetical protein
MSLFGSHRGDSCLGHIHLLQGCVDLGSLRQSQPCVAVENMAQRRRWRSLAVVQTEGRRDRGEVRLDIVNRAVDAGFAPCHFERPQDSCYPGQCRSWDSEYIPISFLTHS